jgi:ankyrin repeat/BTB/POZ domain-containing protein 1
MDMNVRDQWDSTPLYYACLCGHADIVAYLLSMGARCDAHTFDGERCIYGALTGRSAPSFYIKLLFSVDIRNMLRSACVLSRTTARRHLHHEFLRRLNETGMYADVHFMVHGHAFHVHR